MFETARSLCASANPDDRRLGADILGQLGSPDRPYREETVPILIGLLEGDEDPDVLQSAAVAFGHLDDPRGIEPLARLKDHPDADVRNGAVFGLLGLEDERAIRLLIELSGDEDGDVRDWATFGLGSMVEADTPEIREALMRRADDPVADVVGEALVGLARRHDRRTLEPLLRELWSVHARGVGAGSLLVEAAEELADSRLCPALLALLKQGKSEGGLPDAIAACHCGGAPADGP